jgi:hypothetical protein
LRTGPDLLGAEQPKVRAVCLPRTDEILPILVDKDNHCIDALRYALEDERLGARPLIMPPEVLQKFAAAGTRDRFSGVRATMVTRNRFARAR